MRCCCLLNAAAWASYAAASEAFAVRMKTTCSGGPLAGSAAVDSAARPGAQPAPPRTLSAARAALAAPGTSNPRRLIARCIPCIMS